MSTNAFAFKGALRDMIKALPDLAGYQVTWGYPMRNPERRWVFVGEVQWPDSQWATNRSREEVFEISVVVNCQLSAATSEEVESELQRMAAGIENGMKASPNLGIQSVVTSDFIPKKLSSFPSDQVYEGQFEAVVRVKARL
ncbi:hypothetical protein J7E99_14830 [Streptomyces sp. ISL-44]|uniref:hypothetical protein n=1 Tax=Streptomyces sp. ISL-44 TaxID=2819184 RepID=UPI001BEBA04B|nr:hypothetical protein [Streptomyces sp. ISL-44]MBT2541945.1 hypothetical protein [Streptomyces sp. ISL-44]